MKTKQILSLLLVVFLSSVSYAQDLSLQFSTDNPNVGIYEYVVITATVSNTGDNTATDITARFDLPTTVAVAGEFPPLASQGDLDDFYGGSIYGYWEIGDLAAGASADLSITFFTLADNNIFYGQILSMNEPDADSTPGNGTCCAIGEDDEAVINFPDTGSPSFGSINGFLWQDSNRDGVFNAGENPVSGQRLNLHVLNAPAQAIASTQSDSQGNYVFDNLTTDEQYFVVLAYDETFLPSSIKPNNSTTITNNLNDGGISNPISLTPVEPTTINAALWNANDCTFQTAYVETECNGNGTFNVRYRADGEGDYHVLSEEQELSRNVVYAQGFQELSSLPTDIEPFTLTFTNRKTFNVQSENCGTIVTVNPPECVVGDAVDLAITVSSPTPDIPIYQAGEVTFLLTNTGAITANNVLVEFSKNNTLNLVGGPTVSQGIVTEYWLQDFMWNVGSIPAGASASVTFDAFILSSNPNFYAQVFAVTEADEDSVPGNGNGTTPQEDDEASYPENSTPPLEIADLKLADLNLESTTLESGEMLSYNFDIINSGNAPTTVPTDVSAWISTDLTLDAGDMLAGTSAVNAGLAAGEQLDNVAEQLLVSLAPGNYYLILEVDANDVVAESNEQNNTLIAAFSVIGEPSEGVDVELTASDNFPGQWQHAVATFTLTNAGTGNATNIQVRFDKNGTVNFTSSPFTSQGSISQYWTDNPVWNVGDLAAGESVTADISLFTLSSNPALFAEVINLNEQDVDSTPGNGIGASPNEDDEAVWDGNAISNDEFEMLQIPNETEAEIASNMLEQAVDIVAFPAPFRTELTVQFYSKFKQTAEVYLMSPEGQSQFTQKVDALIGRNELLIATKDFAPGFYLLIVKTGDDTRMKKLVKI